MDAIDKIHIRLKKIKEYTDYLRGFVGINPTELESDTQKRYGIERCFQLTIDAVLDISNLLNAEYRLPPIDSGKEGIIALGNAGILDKEFANEFSNIAGFRNILVHDYLDIDYGKMADYLNNHLDDFDSFSSQVANFLK